MYVHGMIGELSTSSRMPYASIRILYSVNLPSLAARRILQSNSIPPWSDPSVVFPFGRCFLDESSQSRAHLADMLTP